MIQILVLYAEVMPYNVAAFSALLHLRRNVGIHVVCWGPEKKLTPYLPESADRLQYLVESETSLDDLKSLHQTHSYELVLVCGRMEKKYLRFVRYLKKSAKKPTILGQSDEQFSGSKKQKLVKLLSPLLYKRYFDQMLVPGYFQYEYMRYLGFKKDQIHIGAYTADIQKFNEYYKTRQNRTLKGDTFNLLFVGRIEKIKGVELLIDAVSVFNETCDRKIQLKLIGNGSLRERIKNIPFIEHETFKDQDALIDYLNEIDYFILPSFQEPWGVVIHEMAAAGMPIICSDVCGARSAFVFDNYNGFVFRSGSINSLINTLRKAEKISTERLELFQKRSFELSKSITPDLWAETISSFLPDSAP